MKIIITGSTGMVGEGVLLECLNNNAVSEVLSISRKTCGITHPKLKELLVPDFTKLSDYKNEIAGYDACFFCAGISSVGMAEEKFTHITYTTTMAFAKALVAVNPNMTFTYVSGANTDSTEKGSVMWARVKGKTENELAALGFKKEFNFRPGLMLPYPGQKYANKAYGFVANILKFVMASKIITLSDLGKAMIHSVQRDGIKNILEIKDIKELSK
jgi:uncharacterized protein YbjT (DUF2867 family)